MKLTKQCKAVANYIIEEINKYNEGKNLRQKLLFTTKRLQKLLYFCEVEYMIRNNGSPLFDDEFYAWPSGPVIEEIYHEFMQYQAGDIQPKYDKKEYNLSQDIKFIIDQILEASKVLDTRDLIMMSNVPGGPHSKVFNEKDKDYKQKVSKKETYSYYSRKEIISQLNQGESIINILYQTYGLVKSQRNHLEEESLEQDKPKLLLKNKKSN